MTCVQLLEAVPLRAVAKGWKDVLLLEGVRKLEGRACHGRCMAVDLYPDFSVGNKILFPDFDTA